MVRNNKKRFLDEEIIIRKRELEKQKYVSIETGMYAGDELITFSEVELFEGSMRLFLPDSFIDMPEEYCRTKYISANRPDILKSEIRGEVVFSFQMVEQKLGKSETETSIEQFHQILKRIQPLNLFLGKGTVEKESIAWMDYKGYGIDQPLYQLVYVVSVNEYMMLGTFHCPFYKAESWKLIVQEVLKTVEIEDV